MASVAYQGARTGRPPLLPWRPVLVAVFFGVILAYLCLGAVAVAAAKLGLLGLGVARPDGSGLADWPYPEAGRASTAANAVLWLWILAVTAVVVARLLVRRSDRPFSAVIVFGVLAVTGFAPFLPRGLLDAPWLVGLLLTAALLRLASAFEPLIVPRRLTVAALAVGLALLAVPIVHAVGHPLWPSIGYAENRPAGKAVTFSLRNVSSADVKLQAVYLRWPTWLYAPLVRVVDVRADDHPPLSPPLPPAAARLESPGLPFTVEGQSLVYIQLRLRALGCGSGSLPTRATIEYRVRGDERVESVPVPITPRPCS